MAKGAALHFWLAFFGQRDCLLSRWLDSAQYRCFVFNEIEQILEVAIDAVFLEEFFCLLRNSGNNDFSDGSSSVKQLHAVDCFG